MAQGSSDPSGRLHPDVEHDLYNDTSRRGSWGRTVANGVILLVLLCAIAVGAWLGGDELGTESAKAAVFLGLSFLLVAVGAGTAYVCWRIGRFLLATERELHATVDGVLPLMGKAGVSMDTVNVQLQKVDMIMDSAVDVAESVDTVVRSVSTAITEPVRAVSGLFAGLSGAMTGFRTRLDDDETPDDSWPDIDEQLDADADRYDGRPTGVPADGAASV